MRSVGTRNKPDSYRYLVIKTVYLNVDVNETSQIDLNSCFLLGSLGELIINVIKE